MKEGDIVLAALPQADLRPKIRPAIVLREMDAMEQQRNEPVSPENMELRKQLVAELRALRSRPVTEEEKEFWRLFDEEFERERLTFR